MMQALQKRSTALIITLIVVILATLVGARLSLDRLRSTVTQAFYGGSGGYEQSIGSDLYEIGNNSVNLITVAGRYLPNDDGLLSAVRRDNENLQYHGGQAHKQYLAAQKLQASLEDLDAYLLTLDLSESDKLYQNKLMGNIRSRYLTLDGSEFNDTAKGFNRTLLRFPTNLLSVITGVGPVELYE